MKRFIPHISAMGISLLLGAVLGHVTFAEDTEIQSLVDLVLERHCTDVAEELGEDCISNTYSNDHRELKKLAESDEAPFYNLYLFTYQNIAEGPKEEALKVLADMQPKYSKKELEAIIYDNDLSKIWNKQLSPEEVEAELEELDALESELTASAVGAADPEAGVTAEFLEYQAQAYYIEARRGLLENNDKVGTQEYLLAEYTRLYDAYQKELDFQMENRKLAYQAYASEIFFDNNLNNSANVDILHDLDLINYLLFGEFIVYPDREGGAVELSSEDDLMALFQPTVFEEETEDTLVKLAEEGEIDPYVCLEDESLREALDDYEEYVASNPTETSSSGGSSGSSSSSSDTDDEEEEEEASTARDDFDAFVSELTSSQGDWTRTLPCGDVFCITVNLVQGSWGTTSGSQGEYDMTENCIACHLDYIAAATDETLSGGVQPNKVSQNWFEDGTCKDVADGLNLDFHVYAIPTPIQLDPGDDIDELANEQYENTMNEWLEWSYLNNVGALGKSAAEFEQEAYLNNLELAGTTMSAQETLQTLIEIEAEKSEELAKIITGNDIQVKVESSYNLYHQMAGEFQTMLLYFTNFSDWIKDTYVSEDAPLSELLKKPYCP